jgi:ribosomal-protein-alanine N-acetyltransferase
MQICAASEADLPQVAALHASCFSDAWNVRELHNLLATGNVFCLMAAGDEPQGFVLIRTAADEAEILSLGVAPHARRQGVARALVRAGGTEAFARGARRLFLEVNVNNAAACTLYRRLGFDEMGRRKGYYSEAGGAEDAMILARTLPICT